MSQALIRAALETRLAAVSAIATAYENVAFPTPALPTPYQLAFVLFATPENLEQGAGYNEIGYMQVTLKYPLGTGSGAPLAQAIVIRNGFPKKLSIVNGAVIVVIDKTPSIGNGVPDGDRWALPVKIPFRAQIYP